MIRPLLVVAACAVVCGSTSMASAQTVSWPSANGYVWDIARADGVVADGGGDAFDFHGQLYRFVLGSAPGPRVTFPLVETPGARTLETPAPNVSAGIASRREVYSPAASDWVRYFDSFTNTTSAPITLVIVWGGGLGSDSATTLRASEDGNLTVDAVDGWVVTSDANVGDAMAGVVVGAGHTWVRDTAGLPWSPPSDTSMARWQVTIPPGEARSIVTYLIRGLSERSSSPSGMRGAVGSQTEAVASVARALRTSPDLTGLTRSEVLSLINVRLGALANGAVCRSSAECASGSCADGYCCNTECGGATADCEVCAASLGASANGTCSLASRGVACRTAVTACDVAEVCDGVARACPADAVAPAGTECRAGAGPCDVVEVCSGSSTVCPNDAVRPRGTVCRPTGGACDLAESCNGTAPACPTDVRTSAGTLCRRAAGPCDVAESCDGLASECPPDAFRGPEFECRAAAGPCDPADVCSGGSASCPNVAPGPIVCRPAVDACDAEEVCVGLECPPDLLAPSGRVCRPPVGACDVPEQCDGLVSTCPADIILPDGAPCSDRLACTDSDACRGGACMGSALTCDDSDPCTTDSCEEPSGCTHAPTCGDTGEPHDAGTGSARDASGLDVGWDGRVDADYPPDAGVAPPPGGCGCTFTRASNHGLAFALGLIALALCPRPRSSRRARGGARGRRQP